MTSESGPESRDELVRKVSDVSASSEDLGREEGELSGSDHEIDDDTRSQDGLSRVISPAVFISERSSPSPNLDLFKNSVEASLRVIDKVLGSASALKLPLAESRFVKSPSPILVRVDQNSTDAVTIEYEGVGASVTDAANRQLARSYWEGKEDEPTSRRLSLSSEESDMRVSESRSVSREKRLSPRRSAVDAPSNLIVTKGRCVSSEKQGFSDSPETRKPGSPVDDFPPKIPKSYQCKLNEFFNRTDEESNSSLSTSSRAYPYFGESEKCPSSSNIRVSRDSGYEVGVDHEDLGDSRHSGRKQSGSSSTQRYCDKYSQYDRERLDDDRRKRRSMSDSKRRRHRSGSRTWSKKSRRYRSRERRSPASSTRRSREFSRDKCKFYRYRDGRSRSRSGSRRKRRRSRSRRRSRDRHSKKRRTSRISRRSRSGSCLEDEIAVIVRNRREGKTSPNQSQDDGEFIELDAVNESGASAEAEGSVHSADMSIESVSEKEGSPGPNVNCTAISDNIVTILPEKAPPPIQHEIDESIYDPEEPLGVDVPLKELAISTASTPEREYGDQGPTSPSTAKQPPKDGVVINSPKKIIPVKNYASLVDQSGKSSKSEELTPLKQSLLDAAISGRPDRMCEILREAEAKKQEPGKTEKSRKSRFSSRVSQDNIEQDNPWVALKQQVQSIQQQTGITVVKNLPLMANVNEEEKKETASFGLSSKLQEIINTYGKSHKSPTYDNPPLLSEQNSSNISLITKMLADLAKTVSTSDAGNTPVSTRSGQSDVDQIMRNIMEYCSSKPSHDRAQVSSQPSTSSYVNYSPASSQFAEQPSTNTIPQHARGNELSQSYWASTSSSNELIPAWGASAHSSVPHSTQASNDGIQDDSRFHTLNAVAGYNDGAGLACSTGGSDRSVALERPTFSPDLWDVSLHSEAQQAGILADKSATLRSTAPTEDTATMPLPELVVRDNALLDTDDMVISEQNSPNETETNITPVINKPTFSNNITTTAPPDPSISPSPQYPPHSPDPELFPGLARYSPTHPSFFEPQPRINRTTIVPDPVTIPMSPVPCTRSPDVLTPASPDRVLIPTSPEPLIRDAMAIAKATATDLIENSRKFRENLARLDTVASESRHETRSVSPVTTNRDRTVIRRSLSPEDRNRCKSTDRSSTAVRPSTSGNDPGGSSTETSSSIRYSVRSRERWSLQMRRGSGASKSRGARTWRRIGHYGATPPLRVPRSIHVQLAEMINRLRREKAMERWVQYQNRLSGSM